MVKVQISLINNLFQSILKMQKVDKAYLLVALSILHKLVQLTRKTVTRTRRQSVATFMAQAGSVDVRILTAPINTRSTSLKTPVH